MQDAKQRQSGGVIVFIIVGLVLAALLGGAIYASKQQGRTASRAGTVAIDDQNGQKDNQKTGDSSPQTSQPDATNSHEDEDGQNSTATPPASGTSDSQSTPTPGQGSGEAVPATGPTHIASTGPENAVIPGLGLALVTAGLVSYHRSQRSIRVRSLKQ